jgi:hypothetical protein
MSSNKQKNSADQGRIRLADAEPEHDVSKLAVFVLDGAGKVLASAPVDKDGQFKVSTDVRGAQRVAIAEAPAKGDEPDLTNAIEFHAGDFAQRLVTNGELVVPKDRWSAIYQVLHCVSGNVRKCWPRYYFDEVRAFSDASFSTKLGSTALGPNVADIGPAEFARTEISPFFQRCAPICNALVRVFRRVCCCRPWIYHDPRLDLLKLRLREIIPVVPWPPGPGPDPSPLRRAAQPLAESPQFFAMRSDSGALDPELVANAAADLKALETLPAAETLSYVWARPYLAYLLCSCGPAVEMGQDFVNPDGTFSVCWYGPLIFLLPGCHFQYAFKVTQVINGQNVTIYDGVSSGAWFDQQSGITLTTRDWRAVTCHTDPSPVDVGGAYVMLQDIGNTNAYRLSTPNADGAFSVGVPAIHSGLLDADNIVNSTNTGANRNLGGTLNLRIHFSNVSGASMKALGATHYRVTVTQADSSGDPTGGQTQYDSVLHWLYYQVDAAHLVTVESEKLGPFTIGAGASARTNVYKIPYSDDHDWQDGQWHSFINTTQFADDRYLITIEVFKADGTRLRPNGAPALGDGTEATAGFQFLQWKEETGPTSTHSVPFAALTNLMWWDNRPPVSELISLSGSGGSGADCQFLSGHATDTLAVTVKAYHPNPLFIAGRSLVAYRGIHDTVGNAFVLPPVNFAAPTADVTSDPKTLASLLGPTTKCSFALVMATWAKTTNGIGSVWGPAVANGAFALEQI